MLNVVVLNGGRGAASLLEALLSRHGLNITSIVNAYDDGKSTGEIRKFFGMLGPSDIRKVQEIMLPGQDPNYDANLRLFQYRYLKNASRDAVLTELSNFVSSDSSLLCGIEFKNVTVRSRIQAYLAEFISTLILVEKIQRKKFSFNDCAIMNCVYAGAFLTHQRNIDNATHAIDRLFNLRGRVLPTAIENKQLVAIRENGEMLYSEAEIVELRSNVRIEQLYLLDQPLSRARFEKLSFAQKKTFLAKHHCFVAASNSVKLALRQADIIIYAPGTQHSSLYPTYFSSGVAQSIADNRDAFKVFITNIGADYETPSYQASDYIRGAFRYLNMTDLRDYHIQDLFDVTLINRSRLKRDDSYVSYDISGFADIPIRQVVDNFESVRCPGRHDGQKILDVIFRLFGDQS